VSEASKLRLVVSRSHRSKSTDKVVKRLGIKEEMRSGSVGLKIGLIAEKKADLYVHISRRSSAWDACAPDAILRAAGGRFTDLGGKKFEYGGEDLANRRGILACNARAFDTVLPVVSQIARDQGMIKDEE
jgi:3'(2'), 5'-bisphosphate nucleotidase